MNTASTSVTSMPRAATSVATSTASSPALKRAMILLRSACERSPCRQSTSKFSRASWFESMAVVYFVLQNTITRE